MAATDSPAGRAHAALVTAVVLVALAGCTSYAPAATAPHPTKSTFGASSPADSPSPCRTGTPLPGGGGVIIEYVDFIQIGQTQFVYGLPDAIPHTSVADLGTEVFRVQCRLSDLPDTIAPLSPVDGDAAFLAPGTAVYAVNGFDPRCRIAAVVRGRVQVYLAQDEVQSQAAAQPCALTPTATPRG